MLSMLEDQLWKYRNKKYKILQNNNNCPDCTCYGCYKKGECGGCNNNYKQNWKVKKIYKIKTHVCEYEGIHCRQKCELRSENMAIDDYCSTYIPLGDGKAIKTCTIMPQTWFWQEHHIPMELLMLDEGDKNFTFYIKLWVYRELPNVKDFLQYLRREYLCLPFN